MGLDKERVVGCNKFLLQSSAETIFCHSLWSHKVKNKTAQQVSSNTYVILNRVLVEKEDVYQAVNDTTSATLAASKLITAKGEQGTCIMHKTNLVIEHACGIKTRSKGGDVCNEFPECEKV